ncbi:granzyme B(G,H)-like [Drosophila eugracilis]|uniref:granzyme B(G,H)-like n=1 Tax=Drosophila eugracilis TaxID=29029 RepID=UPI001BDB4029|nr:granzyme B(G,H)-like [Drosophila eugracilis]
MIKTCFQCALIWGILFLNPAPATGSFSAARITTLMNLKYNCDMHNRQYMHGGQNVSWNFAPYMALLYLPDDLNECRCGGSLVTRNFILTAAHCLEMCPRKHELKVCLGASQITSPSSCMKNFGIERRFVHEEFSWSEQINDVALLKLDGLVDNRDSRMHPFTSLPGQTYFAYGWGTTELGTHSKSLQEIIVNNRPCAYHTDGMFFCTTSRIVDSCRGDSGGPVVSQSTQFGIISHGNYACGMQGGAFNTNVSLFMPWIIDKLQNYPDYNYRDLAES